MPQKPTIEPTDRSMPPLRMTNVMPIARIALIATCLTRIDRLPVVRNSGDSSEKTSVTTARAMKARSRSTRASERATQRIGATLRCPASPTPPTPAPRRSSSGPDRSAVIRPRAITSARSPRPAFRARSGGREHDGHALGGQPSHGVDDLALGGRRPRRVSARPSAARAAGVMTLRAITTFCWLPPLSASIGASQRRRLDAKLRRPFRLPRSASRAGER